MDILNSLYEDIFKGKVSVTKVLRIISWLFTAYISNQVFVLVFGKYHIGNLLDYEKVASFILNGTFLYPLGVIFIVRVVFVSITLYITELTLHGRNHWENADLNLEQVLKKEIEAVVFTSDKIQEKLNKQPAVKAYLERLFSNTKRRNQMEKLSRGLRILSERLKDSVSFVFQAFIAVLILAIASGNTPGYVFLAIVTLFGIAYIAIIYHLIKAMSESVILFKMLAKKEKSQNEKPESGQP